MADKYVKCSLDECNRNAHWTKRGVKGLCSAHHYRLRVHGDPRCGPALTEEPQDFIRKAAKYSGDECLLWPHGLAGGGYGRVRWNGRTMTAHRAVLMLVTGEDPKDMQAAHAPVICHDRLCCNPKHLSWETNAGNQAHRLEDETDHRGEKHPNSTLTEDDVREIRRRIKAGESQPSIARSFGVGSRAISKINTGKRWSHV